MKIFNISLFTFLFLSCSQKVNDFKVETKVNNFDRSSILDLINQEIFKDLNQELNYEIKHLKISNNFAWLEATAERKDKKIIEFPDASYDCCDVEGLFEKKNSKWAIIEVGWFSTDSWYSGLAKKYPKIPKEIFNESQLN